MRRLAALRQTNRPSEVFYAREVQRRLCEWLEPSSEKKGMILQYRTLDLQVRVRARVSARSDVGCGGECSHPTQDVLRNSR